MDDTLARYAAVGIPKAKLGMGTGFYAICYTGGITGPRQPTTSSTQIVGGDNNFPLTAFYAAVGTYDTHPAERQRDVIAKQPYLSLTAHLRLPSVPTAKICRNNITSNDLQWFLFFTAYQVMPPGRGPEIGSRSGY